MIQNEFADYLRKLGKSENTLAVNARETMGGLFLANPCELNDEDCAGIFERSYR